MRTFQAIVACTLAFSAMPTWAAPLNGRAPIDDVFYMYMPIAWRDSDNDAARFGDFGGMTAALPYLEALGITAIWMNPIFPSPGYHGYQHDAADQINSRFGTEADFLSFVAAAHARGIKVFIDFVVYGISDRSIWYQDAFGNPASVFDDYLAFTNGSNTSFLGSNFTTWNGDSVGFIHWNLNNATVTDMVTTWAERWLDPNIDGNFLDGVDGYRLDHVSAFDPVESPWGYDLAWWIAWHNRIRALNPDVFTFAEQADWGSHGADLLPAFDAAMTKPWEFAARSALANESANDLYTQMGVTLGTLPAGELYLATIGDHDVDRIASVIGGSLNKAKSAAAVLLTQPFPPVIYYGDEIGMLGVKQNYGSDANDIPFREPFKWNAVAGPPMSNYWVLNNQAFNNPFSGDNDGRSVEEQDGVPGSLLETYKSLIAARKANSALRVGTYSAVSNSSSAVWAFLRYDATGGQTLLVAINLSGTGVTATLDLTSAGIPGGSTTVQDVITGSFLPLLTDANKAAYGLSLGAYGFAILDVNVIPGQGGPPTGGRDGLNIPGDLGAANLIALQDNETGLGDNVSEANALYLRPTASGIEIGIPGNVQANGTGFVILFDSDPVQGQSQLQTAGMPTPPSAIPPLDGTTFDTGFDPEILIFANAFGGQLFVDRYTLDSAGGGQKRYVGMSVVDSGAAPLSGGSNPNGMELAMNNTNTAGVTDINASGAASASSGLEGLLPYADALFDPAATSVKVMVMMVLPNGTVGNQILPGLGGGVGLPGLSPDFRATPGDQFAVVSLIVPGDFNGDRLFNLADYSFFDDCLTGPAAPGGLGAGCEVFDFVADTAIDLRDFQAVQQRL